MELSIKSIINRSHNWLKEHKLTVLVGVIFALSLLLMLSLGFILGRLYNPPPLIIE